MKIEGLLSKPTITSSRTLTIYSAAVIAVIFTHTNLEKLPGIGWLGCSDFDRYIIVLAVLLFMMIAHFINFSRDAAASLVDKQKSDLEAFREEQITDVSDQSELPAKRRALLQAVKDERSVELLESIQTRDWWNRVALRGMHRSVPMALAVAACIMLGWKIYPLLSVAELGEVVACTSSG